MLFTFDLLKFFDAADMTAVTERCVQKDLDDLTNLVFAEQIGAEAKDVAVIVLPGTAGGDFVVDEGGADASQFVGDDRHADAASVEENADVKITAGDLLGDGDGVIGIVDGSGSFATEILNFVTEFGECRRQAFFGFEAAMIGGDGNSNGHSFPFLDVWSRRTTFQFFLTAR